MKTQKTKLTPIPASIYEILLLNKGGVVPDEILIRHVYGDELDINNRIYSMRIQISTYVRPFAFMEGYKIERLKSRGFIMSGIYEASQIKPKLPKLKKIVLKKPLKIIMWDRFKCIDVHGTFEELAILIERNPLTIKQAFYEKKWCNKRYFFRRLEGDLIPLFTRESSMYKPMRDIEIFKSYKNLISEKKQEHNELKSSIKIDSRTRIMLRN